MGIFLKEQKRSNDGKAVLNVGNGERIEGMWFVYWVSDGVNCGPMEWFVGKLNGGCSKQIFKKFKEKR